MSSDVMRLSGVNSGFDTEAMIEQMMSAYQTKIDTQNKKLQKLQWQQEQYRDVTSKLTTFKSKYFDILKRDTYLMSPSSFSKFKSTVTTKSGKESGLKVTTDSKSTPGTHKIKVDQLATAATRKGGTVAPANFKLDIDKAIADGTADADGKYNFSLDVKVGSVSKTVEFSGADKDEILADLNTNLAKSFGAASGSDLFIQANDNGNGTFGFVLNGNTTVSVTEKTGNFGLGKAAEKVAIDPSAALTGTSSISVTFANHYTGDPVTKNIEFETVSSTYFDGRGSDTDVNNQFLELKKAAYRKAYNISSDTEVTETEMNEANFKYTSADAASDLNTTNLTAALNSAFAFEQGVSFTLSGSSMTAKFVDGSAVEFTMTSTCDATFGLKKGSASSYIADNTKLSEMGIAMNKTDDEGNAVGYSMTINGKEISVGKDATVADLMNAVNKSDAGVTMTYSKLEGRFVLTANDKGSGGAIEIDAGDTVAAAFGLASAATTAGQNAKINIDGTDVYYNDNTYELDGIKFDFSDVDPTDSETITVNVEKDYTDIKQTIKDFVKDYNQMIDDVNGYVYTARPQDSNKNYYEPLTDEEKEDMSDKEVEKWETAAKKGLLYHDSTIMGVMSKIRTALYGSVELEDGTKFGLYNMGIKTSSDYSDHGKLKIDEDALDKAFENNPDAIVKLFTDSENGIMKKAAAAIDDAVKDTGKVKGTLVRKAGLETGTSAKDNAIYKEMERINKRIEQLQDRYDQKEEYWWKVFTNLEKMQSEFNEQQSYMSNFISGLGGTQ